MYFSKMTLPLLMLIALVSCQKDAVQGDPAESMMPVGTFSAARSGDFQKQNGYNAEGTAEIGTDEAGEQWFHLAPNFNASLSTGAVTVYLSTGQNLALGTEGSFRKIDLVMVPGEHFYRVSPALGTEFKFAILWCASAGVQFGNAEMK
jgi:hypothetical protein